MTRLLSDGAKPSSFIVNGAGSDTGLIVGATSTFSYEGGRGDEAGGSILVVSPAFLRMYASMMRRGRAYLGVTARQSRYRNRYGCTDLSAAMDDKCSTKCITSVVIAPTSMSCGKRFTIFKMKTPENAVIIRVS